jgi:hypothetical protein
MSPDRTLRGSATCFSASRNSFSLSMKNNRIRLEFGFNKRIRDPQIELPETGLRLLVDITERIYTSVFQMWAWGRFRFLLVKRQDSETREREMHSLLKKKKKKKKKKNFNISQRCVFFSFCFMRMCEQVWKPTNNAAAGCCCSAVFKFLLTFDIFFYIYIYIYIYIPRPSSLFLLGQI